MFTSYCIVSVYIYIHVFTHVITTLKFICSARSFQFYTSSKDIICDIISYRCTIPCIRLHSRSPHHITFHDVVLCHDLSDYNFKYVYLMFFQVEHISRMHICTHCSKVTIDGRTRDKTHTHTHTWELHCLLSRWCIVFWWYIPIGSM